MYTGRRPLRAIKSPDKWVLIEEIRQGSQLGDIDIDCRRTDINNHPSKAFEIHIEDGIIRTATRELPFYEPHPWIDEFTVGHGKKCSICFDGKWELTEGKWSLVTDPFPWMFWIDNSNMLKAQMWGSSTDITLATNVSDLASIRGWKNVTFNEHDEGLIVAYISENKLKYRNYAFQSASETYVWEIEREIDMEGKLVRGISLFRTNEYRTGFIVNTDIGTELLLTKRNWANMATEVHSLSAGN